MVAAATPDGADNLTQQLAQAGQALANAPLNETMAKLVVIGLESVAENFDASATAGGVAWAERKDKGDGHPLLIDTGRMMSAALGSEIGLSSLARPNAEGASEHRRSIEARDAEVEVGTPYAGAHMQGRVNMPARPFMEVSGEAVDKMAEAMADDVFKMVCDALGAK